MKIKPIRVVMLIVVILTGGLLVAYMAGLGGGASPEIDQIYKQPPQGATRVLFVGNSHTYRHDVPGMVQRLGEAAGTPIWVEQQVAGGASLARHWSDKQLRRRIVDGNWDYVVLQGQSLRPALEPRPYRADVGAFSDLVRRAGATPVIYATWARARWSGFYGPKSPVQKPRQLRDMLDESFRDAQSEHETRVAPVGTAWMAFRRRHAAVPLHSKDGNHATVVGAYLAAAVIFHVLTGESVVGNPFVPAGIAPEMAAELQRVAEESPGRWSPEPVEEAQPDSAAGADDAKTREEQGEPAAAE